MTVEIMIVLTFVVAAVILFATEKIPVDLVRFCIVMVGGYDVWRERLKTKAAGSKLCSLAAFCSSR